MIGVIGPQDSVELVLEVAREIRLQDALVPRVYAEPREAPALAAGLRGVCQVLLYTGRAPFMLAGGTAGQRADFIPHGGADLYRTIGALLLLPEFRASFPSLSIDSIEASNVTEAFGELGLRAPQHVIPLTREGSMDLPRIASEHLRLFRAGKVQFCLTCIGYVSMELARAGVPAMRIVHSRLVIRESLDKARLALDLSRAEGSQVAACVLCLRKAKYSGGSPKSLQRALLLAARKCAAVVDGRIVKQSPQEVVVLTTRGVVNRSIKDGLLGHSKQLRGAIALGIGYGPSASIAEEQGRRAVETADPQSEAVHVTSADHVKKHRAGNLRAAHRLKVSPTMARRLIWAFTTLDPESFTAGELAAAYRVNPRSARRLISLLRAQDLAEECGIEKHTGAGRPMPVYRIALSRLTGAIE